MDNSTFSPNSAQDFERVAPLFAALSDSTRLQLVSQLSSEGPQSISTLAEDSPISRQAVTKHLKELEKSGIAESRRDGRKRIFELQPDELDIIHRHLNQISQQWDKTLERLEAYIENKKEQQ